MARATIFITGYEKRKRIKHDYWYSYLQEEGRGILRIYKRDEVVFEWEAKIQDAFEVIEKPKGIFVTEMVPPRKKGEAIAWLLGFSKRERASSCEEYRNLLNARLASLPALGYVEYMAVSVRFEFVRYCLIDQKDNRRHNLACWVDEHVSKEEILYLVPEFQYPKFYVKKVLWEKFGIRGDEVERALSFNSQL